MDQVCAVCDTKAPHRCSSCSLVAYCSAEHQKEHWKVHRKSCAFFKIVEDSKLGKGFVATRDINPGTIILEEEPVMITPFNDIGLACMSCGLVVDGFLGFMGSRNCSHCKWPVCSLDCAKHPLHSDNECQIFASKKYPYRNVSYLADLVMTIRVSLLKRKSPAMYEQVLQLCSELTSAHPGKVKALGQLEHNMKVLLAGVEGVEMGDIGKLLRIVHINSYANSQPQKNSDSGLMEDRSIAGLYLKSSRINHSCIPNCCWELHSIHKFKIRVRTTSAVKKGEALTICYYTEEIEDPNERRQKSVSAECFRCECKRCKDPTELGTFMSGIICKTCRENKSCTLGYLLPDDPMNLSDDAKWKCNYCGCIQLANEILPEVEKLEQRISNLEIQFGNNPCDNRLIQLCKTFIKETSGVTLHPNHWIIQKAMKAMGTYLQNYRKPTMTLDLCDYVIKCWKHLLSIHDLLTPGLTRSRAYLQEQLATLYHLQCCAMVSQREYKQVEINLEESLVYYKEALKFFEKDLPTTTGVVATAETVRKKFARVSEELVILRLDYLNVSDSKK